MALLEKAIAHHQDGSFEASIPIIYAQIDGLSRDLTGASFFSKANNDPYIDDETLAGMESNLPTVRRAFSADVNESGAYGLVSRHGVMHGRDLAYATRVNSTKAVVLIAALAEYFPRIANDAGARLRRLHEQAVAGSAELDDLGRLIDDREVPEIQDAAWAARLQGRSAHQLDRSEARARSPALHIWCRRGRVVVALHDTVRPSPRLRGETQYECRASPSRRLALGFQHGP